jgi:glucose/mannose-6-phosphate isomerase
MQFNINAKFYNDILGFQEQFTKGRDLVNSIDFPTNSNVNNIYFCGMGGSCFFVDLINNISLYHFKSSKFVRPFRGYTTPESIDSNDLCFVASHSGNTEESLACYQKLRSQNANIFVLASGGKLLEAAKNDQTPFAVIPTGTQPRLATGYFIGAVFAVLEKYSVLPKGAVENLVEATKDLNSLVDESQAQEIAEKIAGDQKQISTTKVPLIYGQEETEGLARVSKIKFNENVKIQAFSNFFPEANHNEMVGFTNMIMNPFFIFFSSNLTNQRNSLRIEKFIQVLKLNETNHIVVNLKGDNLITQTFSTYILIDLITVYLAETLGIQAEPVDMVEDFKQLLI